MMWVSFDTNGKPFLGLVPCIAIPLLNGLGRAENRERFNVFSATGETDLKVNCYK